MTQDSLQQDLIKPQRKAKTLEDEIAIGGLQKNPQK